MMSKMYSARASSIGDVGEAHRKALALTNWDPSRFMEGTSLSASANDAATPSVSKAVGSITPTNENEDDEKDQDGEEWENSITRATASKRLPASPTYITTPAITTPIPSDPRKATLLPTTMPMLDPYTVSPTTTPSVGTSTVPIQVVLETSTPISMNPTASPIAYFETTTVATAPATEYPSIHLVWTYAPATQFPTHQPTFVTILTGAPATYSPTFFPTYAPTYAAVLQSSEPTTIKPTPFPSHEPVSLVRESASCHRSYDTSICFLWFLGIIQLVLFSSIARPQSSPPTTDMTYAPSYSESVYPSATPTTVPFAQPQVVPLVTNSPSISGLLVPSTAPSQGSVTVEGTLTFQLNMDRLMEDNVAVFESTVEAFFRERLSSKLVLDYNSDLVFSSYNVAVASQTLVPLEQSPSTNTSVEPLRVRRLGSSGTLFIVTSVTAIGTPADLAADFPFQTAISVILFDCSDEINDALFSSGAFEGMQTSEQTIEHVKLNGSDAEMNKPLILGGSVAGIVVLLILAGAFFVLQRRHERKAENPEKVVSCIAPLAAWTVREIDEEKGHCKLSCLNVGYYSTNSPHTVPPFLDEEGNDLSSLEDSLNPNNHETDSHGGSDLSSLEASLNNFSKIISHEDSDLSSEDSHRPETMDQIVSREDVTFFEDSLNPANYTQNFPFAFDGDMSINISADLETQGDEWSLDDNFQSEMKAYKMNHSYMTDSEGDESSSTLSITSADLEGSLLSYVENA